MEHIARRHIDEKQGGDNDQEEDHPAGSHEILTEVEIEDALENASGLYRLNGPASLRNSRKFSAEVSDREFSLTPLATLLIRHGLGVEVIQTILEAITKPYTLKEGYLQLSLTSKEQLEFPIVTPFQPSLDYNIGLFMDQFETVLGSREKLLLSGDLGLHVNFVHKEQFGGRVNFRTCRTVAEFTQRKTSTWDPQTGSGDLSCLASCIAAYYQIKKCREGGKNFRKRRFFRNPQLCPSFQKLVDFFLQAAGVSRQTPATLESVNNFQVFLNRPMYQTEIIIYNAPRRDAMVYHGRPTRSWQHQYNKQ